MAKPAQTSSAQTDASGRRPGSRRAELISFLVVAIIIWPLIAVAVVGGYGFIVWMLQLIFGPPGPPA